MALTNLFRINFPYGIMHTDNGKWCFFNREYLPLSETNYNIKDAGLEHLENFSVSYKGLTFKKLEMIIKTHQDFFKVKKIDDNYLIYFYDDGCNPSNTKKYDAYFNIMKDLSNFKI